MGRKEGRKKGGKKEGGIKGRSERKEEGGKERSKKGKKERRERRKNSLWKNVTKRKVIGGIGRPFLTAFTIKVFLLLYSSATVIS